MKLLIVTNNLQPYTNANSAIVYRIADELRDKYGVEILFLGLQTAPVQDTTPKDDYPSWYITSEYNYKNKIPAGLSNYQKVLRLFLHPSCMAYRLNKVLMRYPYWIEYQRMLRKILRNEKDIDCILCCTCPHDTLYAAAKVVRGIPVAAYKLDPWGTHFQYQNDSRYSLDEQWADGCCSAIFVTDEIFREYQQGKYNPPTDRIYPMKFPNLLPRTEIPESFDPKFEKGQIHCAYVGQLYAEGLRGPGFLFDIFRHLTDTNIVLHIIGNTEAQAKAYEKDLPPNVILHGRVSQQEAKAYMQSADILVNIGNTISNQMPSKPVDYISCGKPIMNICKIPDCPTLPYMEKYPLALNVMESEGINTEVTGQIVEFCQMNAGKNLPYETVRSLFPDCTPEYVGARVHQVLQELVEERQ